jgi:hypothetical protein
MNNPDLPVMLRKANNFRVLVFIGLVLYLLLFSGFAVFHAYANDELFDPQGCNIGLWVQHGQQVLLANLAVAFGLFVLFHLADHSPFIIPSWVFKDLSARAPPISFLP